MLGLLQRAILSRMEMAHNQVERVQFTRIKTQIQGQKERIHVWKIGRETKKKGQRSQMRREGEGEGWGVEEMGMSLHPGVGQHEAEHSRQQQPHRGRHCERKKHWEILTRFRRTLTKRLFYRVQIGGSLSKLSDSVLIYVINPSITPLFNHITECFKIHLNGLYTI